MEIAEDIRHTPWGRELYKMRCQTIERIFADAKEKHGALYQSTRLEESQTLLHASFCMHEFKKACLMKEKTGHASTRSPYYS
ncbi:hypothetical protein FWJ32_07275 [Calorimonas adulescens]|uniref:Uncharacterized protein n=1 Tax=Calorimonas adulescens TaxID=2606906 RepID=A0A5D8QD30_9THEO|nr:transposase [Calorimonas adulescens]TZE82024.1 hypothetical protein FWJ32_07275 [Calorimonas adulescens]